MKKPTMPRYAPAVAIAAVLVLLGSTGGAVAGSLITSKQIKDNTVTTKDIKNKTLTTKDLSSATVKSLKKGSGATGATGPAGATGAAGPAGAAGAAGAAGPRGFSAWDTIPAGQTVTGRFFDNGRSGSTAIEPVENIQFPAKAPAAPTGFGFGADAFAATTSDDLCTGTYANPTAPAGHVCVYVGGLGGLTPASVNTWDEPAQRPYAFYLQFTESAVDTSWYYYGSWAYTAP